MRRVIWLLGTLIVAGATGCGCGSRSAGAAVDGAPDRFDAAHDAGQADVIARPDGNGADVQADASPCSYGPLDAPAAATHRAVIVYDQFLDFDPGPWGGDSPYYAFVDQEGVAVFGARNTLRASLEGGLVSRVVSPGSAVTVAQGASNYAVVFNVGNDRALCLVDHAGQVTTCPRTYSSTARIGGPYWDGSSYSLLSFGESPWSVSLISFDSTGTFIAERAVDLPGAGEPVFTAGLTEFLATYPGDGMAAGCRSWHLVVFPSSLDPGQRKTWQLLPGDFVTMGMWSLATNGSRSALVYGGKCFLPRPFAPPDEPTCLSGFPPNPPSAVFLTMVGDDGAPLDPIRRQLFEWGPVQWDGARFVMLGQDPGAPANPRIWAFDQNGDFVIQNSPVALGAGGSPMSVHLAPVGDNDYIAVYTLWNSGETRIARFSLLPR